MVGFIDNTNPNFNNLVDDLAEILVANYGVNKALKCGERLQSIPAPEFNLQGIQATTNPAAVWAVVSGPVAKRVGVNAATNCLGPGTHANIGLGRALRLMMLDIGGATPGISPPRAWRRRIWSAPYARADPNWA